MLDLPLLAGAISSAMFVLGTLPMVYKALVTKNLKSYSMTSLLFNNIGNLIHAIYVYSLPPGPIWLLHTFYLIITALMLFWYVRYAGERKFENSDGNVAQFSWTKVTKNATALASRSMR